MGNRTSPHPCDFCGTETGNPRFCSNACHLKGTQEQRAAKRRRPRRPGICPVCGKQDVMRGAVTCGDGRARMPFAAHDRRGHVSAADLPGAKTVAQVRTVAWLCYTEDRYQRTGRFAKWLAGWLSGEISRNAARWKAGLARQTGTSPDQGPALRRVRLEQDQPRQRARTAACRPPDGRQVPVEQAG